MKPYHEEIALCAYHIWEEEGRMHGRDMDHWLQAEKRLVADCKSSQKPKKNNHEKRNRKRENHEN